MITLYPNHTKNLSYIRGIKKLKAFGVRSASSLNSKFIIGHLMNMPYLKSGFPDDAKDLTANVRDVGSIPGLGRSPEEGHGNPLQYSCLENPHGQRRLEGYSHRVANSPIRLHD